MKHFKVFFVIIPLILLSGCYNKVPIERTSVVSGAGHDIIDNKILSGTLEFLIFSDNNKISKDVSIQTGKSVFDMYNKRLLLTKKTYLTGTLKTLLISEDRAKFGISDIIDTFLRDQDRNLNTTVAICKGKASDILNMKPLESTSMSEEIEGLIKSSYETNFTQRDTNIKDLYNMRFQEGRRIMLPYIEKYEDTIKLSSIAVFEGDKMIFKIPEEDVKYVNMLRNENSLGYLNFKGKSTLESFDIISKNKRKVKVNIEDDNITYDIKLNLNSLIKEDSLSEIEELDKKTIENIQQKYSEELKTKLENIIQKYQREYGVDVFDIQKYAVAKLGKDKEKLIIDKFQDSTINVEVEIKINSIGRVIRR
ncbi:germination protein, Ger(x)C family [Caloramator quimbayensis]|uniref:Germination protein, Ger(X)C family n=1 Tax=Caloramator quimbayensis TaxID=1147123 RepID=A0A1T4WN91_9CLOT|nr:Ger(x)C family spore germination protein [Caloramator quimbayensis]SKA78607.1 germination protein, Ger(x)C family [Caloramator quimbayensis]